MMNESSPLINDQDEVSTVIFDNISSTNIKVYKKRWFILIVMTLLNLSSGIMWMSFSNVADIISSFYQISNLQVNWLSIVFMVATLVLALPVIWLLDRNGLRCVFWLAGIFNFMGSVLRVVSTLDFFNERKLYSYYVLLAGQAVAGCAQPFIFCSITKLTSVWFPKHQRTIANSIISTANPVGIAIGSILSTMIVWQSGNADTDRFNIRILLGVQAVLCALVFFLVLFTSSFPPTPPSFSASETTEGFRTGFKKLFCNRQYLLLAMAFGSGIGIISSLLTINDQLLLPSGYTDKFSSYIVLLLFGVGLLGAYVLSSIADRFACHEELSKISFSLGASFIILFVVLTQLANREIYLGILISLAGFFCIALNPLCLELGVETSFPVSEATSGGVMVLSGQLTSCLYTFLLAINEPSNDSTKPISPISKYSILGFVIVVFLSDIIFVIFYKCPYIRKQFEDKKEAERIMEKLRESDEMLINPID